MIRVIDGYGIEVDNRNYMSGKIRKITDKKTGEAKEVIDNPAYTTTFSAALEALRRRLQRDRLNGFEGSLDDALQVVKGLDARFEAACRKSLKF